MRKGFLFFAIALTVMAVCLCAASAAENVVFLSAGGTGDGGSASSPVGTLADAYTALGSSGGTIVIMNEYAIGARYDTPQHTGKVTWTSVYGDTDYRTSGAAFKFTASVRVGFGGPTELDHMKIIDSVGGVFAANYHDLTVGADMITPEVGKTLVIGGANADTTVGAHPAGALSTLTVQSGTYAMVVAFSRSVAGVNHSGTVVVNLCGNTKVATCSLGTMNATNAKSGTGILNISDNAAITGTLYLCSSNTTNSTANGSVTVNARKNASISAILRYLATYFPNGTRTLNYEATASLPENLSTYFGTVNLVEPLPPEEEPDIYETVYLAAGAQGNGASPASPCGSFADALAHLDPTKDGKLVLVGSYSVNADTQLPAYTGTLLITSVDGGTDYRTGGAALVFSGEHHLAVGGPTVFDGIRLQCTNVGTAQIASIAGNFFPLTLGKDVQTVNASGADSASLYIVGGPNNDTSKSALPAGSSSTLTVESGSYQGITVFSRRIANLSHRGTMNVRLCGDVYAKDVYLGTMGTAAAGGTTLFTAEDNVTIDKLYLANYTNTKTNGTVTVTLKDYVTVGALDKCADTYFVQSGAKTLCTALTASVPNADAFDTVTLIDTAYLTLPERSLSGLTYAGVDALDVTAHAKAGLTLPYPEALTAFTLTLSYTEGTVITTYTYAVTVQSGIASALLQSTECFDGSVVYVRDGGSGTGFSPASPCGSLEAAHALLPNGGTVVLIGEVTVSARTDLPTYAGVITYTSVWDGTDYRENGARLYFPNGVTVLLGGEAVFKDIAIHTDTYAYITAGFCPLTFDTGVLTTHTEENLAKDSDEVNGLRLAGGYNTVTLGAVTDARNASITLKSGFFRYVHGFSRYSGKTTYTGTAAITVAGTAVVDELITGAAQNDATAANVNLTLADDACIYNVYVGGQQKTNLLTGRFDFTVTGGDIYEIDALCLYTAADCETVLTYDNNTVPDGLLLLANAAQFKTVRTFCERDDAHEYSAPYASEFDASVLLCRCSVCGDVRFAGELPAPVGGNVVFVASGGIGDGSHPAIPTGDLYAAFEKLKDSGGTVVIINAYTLVTNTKQKIGGAPAFFQEPLHDGAITVTSVYGGVDYRQRGAKFIFDGNVDYKLGGQVTFDHIVFDATEATSANTIAARYYPITVGEDVVMLRDMDDAYALDLIGGYLYFRYTDFTDVTVDDEWIEMVNPARPLEIVPETGDYTIDPDDITYVEKEGVASTFFLRKEAGDAINRMFADMYALGLKRPDWISYAWRGYYAQYDGYSKQVGNIRVNYPTYDFERAHKTVLQSCSLPGSSEHHLGLAIDFHDSTVSETNPHMKYDTTPEWAWLVRNAYKYGFILRFTPKDTATTGFIYEAWHFRYVGTEHAAALAMLNTNGDPVANADMLAAPEWCLEEYAGLVLGMYDRDANVTVNGGTFAHIEGGSRGCEQLTFTGAENVVIGENAKLMPEGSTHDVIYYSEGASGDGLSASSPVGTLEKAYALLGDDGGRLVWMGQLSVGAALELPAHTGTVTITSVDGGIDYRESGAALRYTAAIRVAFNGPTVLENFKIINGQSGDHLLCANFHPLTLGDGMVLVDKDGKTANSLLVIGGNNNNLSIPPLGDGKTNTVTVRSGSYKQIVAFSAYNTGLSHTGTVELSIGGDVTVTSVIAGAKAAGSKGGTTLLTLTDNASVGTLYLANGDTAAVTNGTVTVCVRDQASIGAFANYKAALFQPASARTLYYEETAALPTSLGTYFDNITVLSPGKHIGECDWDDGVFTMPDKDTAKLVYTCSLCGEHKVEDLPVTGNGAEDARMIGIGQGDYAFIAAVDSLAYESVGFAVTVNGSEPKTFTVGTVYESIRAGEDVSFTSADFGTSGYVYGLIVKGIPADADITFTKVALTGGGKLER